MRTGIRLLLLYRSRQLIRPLTLEENSPYNNLVQHQEVILSSLKHPGGNRYYRWPDMCLTWPDIRNISLARTIRTIISYSNSQQQAIVLAKYNNTNISTGYPANNPFLPTSEFCIFIYNWYFSSQKIAKYFKCVRT